MGGMCMGSCSTLQPNTAAGVFVAPGGGSGACGSEMQPCGTIALGLAAIASSSGTKTILYLANGTYTEEVTLPAGITIQGGWLDTGGTWTHQCVANPQSGAIIQAPPGMGTTVIASYMGTATLDTLTVQSIATAAAGQSLYGIMATGAGTSLALNNVEVNVTAGGAGGTGTTGTAGTNGATGNCVLGTGPSDGAIGTNGTPGTGAMAGAFAAGGFTPNTGLAGVGAGTNGHNGGTPTAPGCVTVDSPCEDGCGSCFDDPNYSCCPTAGQCGNAGTGSGPGGPGSGGGSSIGIYVWGASVTVTGGTVTTGAGGNGGDGGPGGAAGTGMTGPSGFAGKTTTGPCGQTCHIVAGMPVCVCKPGGTAICAPAGPGTRGGNGGQGGKGGGGSGGFSYCWYQGGSGMVAAATSAMCMSGAAGLGGSQNAGAATGANGAAGTHN
jgi:hypothetical protein